MSIGAPGALGTGGGPSARDQIILLIPKWKSFKELFDLCLLKHWHFTF